MGCFFVRQAVVSVLAMVWTIIRNLISKTEKSPASMGSGMILPDITQNTKIAQ